MKKYLFIINIFQFYKVFFYFRSFVHKLLYFIILENEEEEKNKEY